MADEELMWQASVEELRRGYVYDGKSEKYVCLFCGAAYEKGVVYEKDDLLTDAEKTAKCHIRDAHGSSFGYLTGLDKQHNGLSAIQKEILSLLREGLSDAEIAARLGNKAKSTIRNHRFVLREKYKEAKVFMAIMEELSETKTVPEEKFVRFHAALPVNDDRVKITEKEKAEIMEKYFEGEHLVGFPKKQKRKLVLLQHIAKMFDPAKKYSETEVNGILKRIYEDYVTIRRYLIDYGFLDRRKDGGEYWVMA